MNDTKSFAANFTSAFGADGAGTLTYALGISLAGVDSGLVDTATGEHVFLFLNGGVVQGLAGGSGGPVVFTVSVNGTTGDVTLDQQRAVVHPDTTNPDDSKTLSADNLVTLTGTITDKDGDSQSAVLNIGQNLTFKDDGPTLNFGNLVGTGTIAPQYGEWMPFVGADQPGNLDISLNQFQLVRPDGTVVSGSSFTFNELASSPNASGDYLFQGTLTADFDNNASTPDTTTGFTLTALHDGRYVFDLDQGFGSTITFSSANGSLDAGGPDPVRTLTIPPDEQVVFFGVQATTSDANILSAIGLGEPDLTEAQIQSGGFSFLGTANMNVSTAGIGIGNNNLDGNTTAGINAGDESFVVNPETLLTGMKVFIDNSVGGYDPSTEELYYKIFYDDGTNSGNIKVGSTDLSAAAGGQKSFMIETEGSKLIDSVQLTMGKGTVKIPVIEFIKSTENLASDIKLGFTASLTDADGDKATSNFSTNLFANDLGGTFDYTLIGAPNDLDGFDVDLSATQDSYRIENFDEPQDTLFLLNGTGATVSINNAGTDSIVSVAEAGGQTTDITVVGVHLQAADVVLV
ncbi:hypothetical protein SAMN05216403_11734 [Nitrosospira multiformis ATCC 25196]|uniref:DUF5801 domain-containing protein n=1 Tax=Nitrosospira multiformis (strain ATCC 25196 / NCIMB 11849 / C 71) TaxID=323848 RepID=Q2Y9J0_NITMU|nr:DUF5801 repeats-in-toxin domain-containing protein [Nitrosospira multiformis]ABB74581.1 hypothetical protein Nmul_A1278 [Nitrosospira multiformis ATCC 25196]SEF95114.1 hypothetical protein SAMN05216403_11734 [Nitrosospira multiformis ATCC 25196]